MPFTTLTRFVLTGAALCSVASHADAKPRRVVVLDFDGPRTLADSGRTAVVNLLGAQYDVVATKRWEDARAAAQQRSHGPTTWQKAAKQAGVDAVIEGWIQDEGRHKVLTVAVREAATGNEVDTVSVKLGDKGLSADRSRKLVSDLDGVLEYIEPGYEPGGPTLPTVPRKWLDAKGEHEDDTDAAPAKKAVKVKKATRVVEEPEEPEDDKAAAPKAKHDDEDEDAKDPEELELKPKKTVAVADEKQETSDLVKLFGPTDESIIVEPKIAHVPRPTPRFMIGGGGYYGSRSLTFGAENQTGPQAYSGVPSKGLEVNAAVYPFPTKKIDGQLSGIGFSFGYAHSAGSVVTFDDLATVSDYVIDQSAWKAAVHYRQPLGSMVTIDGEVNYGRSTYIIEDAPETFEVPDTDYSYLGAGAHLDLAVTERATVGFGGRYMYLMDTGDISSVDWYGPGRAGGWNFDANFVIPLPQNMYLRGELDYTKINIEFDGVGQITEDEGVYEANDATVNAQVNVGITF